MRLIEDLKWRYATKQFDPDKNASQNDIDKIKEAIQLSASSFGLQPYKIIIIENIDTKRKLREAAMNQSQVSDASHLIVLASYTSIQPGMVDEFVELIAKTRNTELDDLKNFGQMIKEFISSKSQKEIQEWSARQTYIALGTLLAACAELRIDACPMEGFSHEQFDKILGLKEKGLTSTVMAAIGYRSEEDDYQHKAKVRKPIDNLYEINS